MNLQFLRDEVRKTQDGYEILIHLAPDSVEFARELGQGGGNEEELNRSVREYVRKKYPNLKASVARVMLGGILVTSIPLGMAGTAGAAPTDMGTISPYAKQAVERLVDQKVIVGDEAGNFNPQGTMNRDAFTTMLVKALGLKLETPATATFRDVPRDHWSFQYVETAYANGLIKGTTTDTFSPGSNVTREQMASIYVRALGLTPDDIKGQGDKLTFTDRDAISAYARDAVGFAVEQGLLVGVGDNKFAGQATATREQVAVMADRFLTNKEKLVTAANALKAFTFTATVDAAAPNTVALKFNRAVDNLSAGDFKVTNKNGATVTVTGVTPGADRTTATLTFGAALTAGDTYTINYRDQMVDVVAVSNVLNVANVYGVNGKLVEVTLNEKISNVDKGAFSITDKDGNPLNVTGASLAPDGRTIAVSTNKQVPNSVYNLKIGADTYKFVGQVTDETAPTLNTALASGNTQVTVNFSENVNVTALNPDNYKIEGLSVTDASFGILPDGSLNKAQVVLKTSAQSVGTIYNLVATNVADEAGNAIDTTKNSFQFGGVPADTGQPGLETVTPTSNTAVTITFTEKVDRGSAESVGNYTLDNGLTVTAATLQADGKTVVLTTSPQSVGSVYKLTASNVKDEAGNVLTTDRNTSYFGGMPADTTAPTLTTAVARTNTSVTVEFNEAMDKGSLTNPANYQIQGLSVTKAELVSNNSVRLTTSAQEQGKIYSVTATGVRDAAGNAIDTERNSFQFGGLAADTIRPEVTVASSTGTNSVVVTFSEEVDPTSATKAYNYYLGTELGYPTKAVLNDDKKSVTLTTATQQSKVYTVKVTDVKDLSGNVLADDKTTTTFGGQSDIGDAAPPKVTSAVATSNNTVNVTFNEPLSGDTVAADDFVFSVYSGAENTTTNTAIAGATPSAIAVSDDKKTVTMQFAQATMTPGVIYKVTVDAGRVADANGNVNVATDNTALFAGTTATNPAPKVTSAVLLDNQTLKVAFSEKVKTTGPLVAGDFTFTDLNGNAANFNGEFVSASLAADGMSATVYYRDSPTANDTDRFQAGTLYRVNVNEARFTDALGVVPLTTENDGDKANFAGVNSNVAVPRVSAVSAVNANTVDVVFDQKITSTLDAANAGDIVVTTQDGTVVTGAVDRLVRVEGTTGDKLRIFFNEGAFTAGQVYKLQLDPTKVTNANGTALSSTANVGSFAAVSTANPAPKLESATASNATTVRVTFSEGVKGVAAGNFTLSGGATVTNVTAIDDRTYDITTSALARGTIYTLSLQNATGVTDEAGVGTANATPTVQFVGR